jgi:hypothetical protein
MEGKMANEFLENVIRSFRPDVDEMTVIEFEDAGLTIYY